MQTSQIVPNCNQQLQWLYDIQVPVSESFEFVTVSTACAPSIDIYLRCCEAALLARQER